MNEGAPQPSLPTHETVSLLDRPGIINSLYGDNPQAEKVAHRLLNRGVPLQLNSLVRTPDSIKSYVNQVVDQARGLRRIALAAVIYGKDPLNLQPKMNSEAITAIAEAVDTSVTVTVPQDRPLTKKQRDALAELNKELDPIRRDHTFRRLRRDRPKEDNEKVMRIGAFAVLAGGAATLLNLADLKGPAMAVAGQTDDILGGITVKASERKKKQKRNVLKSMKENKLLIGAVATATAADFALPDLLASDIWYINAPASIGYALTATAGSIAVTYDNYRNNRKAIRELDAAGNCFASVQKMARLWSSCFSCFLSRF